MDKLLTPEQVADLLQISVKTVYEKSDRFGGFYPAGIRVLRFRQEVINGIMEGQNQGGGIGATASSTKRRCTRSEGAKPLMDLTENLPEDLDFQWYINEADSILHDIAYYEPAPKVKQLTFF